MDCISYVEVLPITAADLDYAAQLFGPISDARDAELPDDFATEDLKPEEEADVRRWMNGLVDPTDPDLDGWDADPAGPGTLANVDDARHVLRLAGDPDDMPPRLWESALVAVLNARGCLNLVIAEAINYARRWGTLECFDYLSDDDRRAGEDCLPGASPAEWAPYEADIWMTAE